MSRRSLPLVLVLAVLAGCSATGTGSGPSGAPAVQVTANTQPPLSVPPLGPDVACTDPMHCQLRNPDKLTDEQWIARLPGVAGGDRAPTEQMRPWAFVVLGLGEGQTDAHAEPRASSPVVGDQYRIVNHRVLFAFCRTPGDPHQAWYLVEPITTDAPPRTWMSGEHLYPYGHDGAIPTC